MEEDICLIGVVVLAVVLDLCGIIVEPQLVLIPVVLESNIAIFIKFITAIGNVAEFIGSVKESVHKLHVALGFIVAIRVYYRFVRKGSCLFPLLVHSSKLIRVKLLRDFGCGVTRVFGFGVRGKALHLWILVPIGYR